MNKPKVQVVGNYPKDFFDQLDKWGEVIKANEICDHADIDDVDILVVRSETRVDKKLVERMPNLKYVITATHGLDHICVDYLKEKKIRCYNAPVQSYDIAQGIMAYILAFSTRLLEADRSMKRGEWRKKELKGFRIQGKTLGIIGYGRIGQEVAGMASRLDMTVFTYDPYVKQNQFGIELDELLENSDFISVHIPLTEATRGMIGKDEIVKMKDGAYIINTARGGIIDEKALQTALDKGKLAGVAIDVYASQPPFENEVSNKLVKDERVIATPHSIGQTVESVEEKGRRVISIIRELQQDKAFQL